MKITLVLHNIRSTYNVGAILRTAEGLGVDQVVTSGWTPSYDDQELLPHLREKLNHQITKSALGAEKTVPQKKVLDLVTWLRQSSQEGAKIIGLENNLAPYEIERQILLGEKTNNLSRNDKLVLILGEEVAGIPLEIREKCDYFLEIPMQGRKESFNVSVATAIALWGLLHPTT